jgi:hypothetical protein
VTQWTHRQYENRRTPYMGFWAVIGAFGVTQLVWVLAPVALVILFAITGE